MNILLYVILFFIGVICGKFYKVAVYRIPRNINLFKKYSYFLNSNEKEKRIEKLSILTYMIIGGMSFVVIAKALEVDVTNIYSMIAYIFTLIYISTIIIISGIDKKYIQIEKKVLTFGIIISIIYMIYMSVINLTSIHRYIIYLGIYIILLTTDTFLLRRYAKDSYTVNMLMLLNVILTFSELEITFYTTLMAILAIFIKLLILKIRKKKTGNKKIKLNEIPVGFFVGASNIIVIYMMAFITNLLQIN